MDGSPPRREADPFRSVSRGSVPEDPFRERRRSSAANSGSVALVDEASLFHQGTNFRIPPPEGAVEARRLARAAAREDHLAEALAVLPRHAAVLPKPVVRVVVED